jgi:hypothetical protein
MNHFRSWAGLLGVLLVCTPAWAAPAKGDRYKGADELAARIDQLMSDAWKKANVTPARSADDAEWLRRVYLDVAGRIPSVTEARTFLADRGSDKRQRLVETLLDGPRYPTWFASVWTGLLLPEVKSNFQVRIQGPAFERWLRNWLVSDRGYDTMVRELLTVSGQTPGVRFGASNAGLFYVAKENKPEEVASAAARLFLGVNLGCAQCHNHPFAEWKKEQFWAFAAFFGDLQARRPVERGRRPERPTPGRIAIPGTEKVVTARFLGGKEAAIEEGTSPREMLVDWLTAPENPYFSRALVNRLWAQFFGIGLVEPLDEMSGAGREASHPEILEELARAFAEHKYDLRWLVRAITATKVYQLSSARSQESQDDPKQFARMALRGMTGEQLFDSLAQATGFQEALPPGRRIIGGSREEFVTKFSSSERPTESQTSILQALTLMNGRVVTAATSVRRSETLQAVIDSPFLDLTGKIETLYLASLSRKPTATELSRLVSHVEKAGTDGRDEALADVFWVLLNSAEFVVNH